MADTKISGLSADTSPDSTDEVATSTGSDNKRVKLTDLVTKAHGLGNGIADISSGTMTVVTKPTGDLVGTTGTQTLEDKTLASPTITGALSVDSLVATGTGTSITASGTILSAGTITASGTGNTIVSSGTILTAGLTVAAPSISDFTSATHNHSNDAGGGATLTSPTINTPTITSPTIAGNEWAAATHTHASDATGGLISGDLNSVLAASTMTDNTILKGDGGVRGAQDSGVTVSDDDDVAGIRDLTFTRDLKGTTAGAILNDTGGFVTLYGIDAVDATTTATIEAVISDVGSLTVDGTLEFTGTLTASGSTIVSSAAGTATLSNIDALDSATTTTIGNAVSPPATTTTAGIIELADITETNTGTATDRAVTPDGLDGWTGSAQIVTVGTLDSSGNADAAVSSGSTTTAGKLELADGNETVAMADTARAVTPDGLGELLQYQRMWIGAGAMTPNTTSGAEVATIEYTTQDHDIDVLKYDAATEEYACVVLSMPPGWDRSTLQAKLYWDIPTTDSTNTVRWAIAARTSRNDDAIDQAVGTDALEDDASIAVGDLHITGAIDITNIAGTAGVDNLLLLKISRDADHANDTYSHDAHLIGMMLEYKVDQITTVWS